ncbi:MAG: sugar ABC transporter permease [Lachnospiraceae bacterium]|nr:sugar ABC transporter permease [Lachnospiraceae bacterium]
MKSWKDKIAPYVFLTPWLLGFVLLTLLPMAMSLYFSFTNYNLLSPPKFIGLANYTKMFTTDLHFLNAVKVTFVYVLISVPLQLIASLVLAIILNKGVSGLSFFRACFYVPSLLGGSVAISILWRQIFGMEGLLNQALQALGINSTISWVANPHTAVWTLIILRVWQFGSPMIIFLAAIKQIPSEMLEAASIDGADRMQRIFKIVLPMISPIILFNLIMQIISAFKVFTESYIISGGNGGVLDSLLFYTLHIFNEGFGKMRMGYASALAWFLVFLMCVVTGLIFVMSKKFVHYE